MDRSTGGQTVDGLVPGTVVVLLAFRALYTVSLWASQDIPTAASVSVFLEQGQPVSSQSGCQLCGGLRKLGFILHLCNSGLC